MLSKFLPALSIFLFGFFVASLAQQSSLATTNEHVGYSVEENNAENPCITAQQYEMIEENCADNITRLGLEANENNALSVTLGWPLRASQNLTDCSYYHISAYVDQNTTTGVIQDFNCGTNTYDGHRGTDIATWPFNFYKMDNSLVEVVASAPGTIIDKHDGEFDRNCTSNNLTANYVIIQHADGSVALYWHMKSGSVTSVAIGQTVATGDHLGVVGSSGSASGPHLHYEIWSGNTVATRIDPYSGTCNTLNASSWWSAQKAYKETGIVRASVHTTDIVLPPCPATETLNESTSFLVPFQGTGLPAGYAKFYIFIRDEVNGLTANLSILNPNSTPYLSWTYTSTSDTKARTWGWSKVLPTIPGTYTFQATYNGITCSSTFDIVNTAGIDAIDFFASAKIYPNPSNGKFIVETGKNNAEQIEVFNMLGEKLFQSEIINGKSEINLNVQKGVYFYKIKDSSFLSSVGKLMVQ